MELNIDGIGKWIYRIRGSMFHRGKTHRTISGRTGVPPWEMVGKRISMGNFLATDLYYQI